MAASENAPNEVLVDKQGFLEYHNPADKKYSKKAKSLWFVLIQGSLFGYKMPTDAEPVVTLAVKGGQISVAADSGKGKGKGSKKGAPLIFKVAGGAADVTLVSVNEEDRDKWVQDLTAATTKETVAAPDRNAVKRSKGGLAFRAKKSLASKTAASGAGKGVMKRLADEETLHLLAALKKVVGKHSTERRATEIENSILKIAVKCYLLVENKQLHGGDFNRVDKPLREAFELTTKIFDRMHSVSDEALLDACMRVEVLYGNAEKVLENLLLPCVKQGTLNRVKDVFSFLSNGKFLFGIFKDESLEDEVCDLVKSMEYYVSFENTN